LRPSGSVQYVYHNFNTLEQQKNAARFAAQAIEMWKTQTGNLINIFYIKQFGLVSQTFRSAA